MSARIEITDTRPMNAVAGQLWGKPCKKGKFLIYCYDGRDWHQTWNSTSVEDMIFILSIFGKVDFKFTEDGDYWMTFCPDHSIAWIYETGSDLRETLVKLVTKAFNLNYLK